MSWNIYIYAEHRKDSNSEWEPVTNKCLFDNYKHYRDDLYDSMNRMAAKSSSIKPIIELSSNSFNDDLAVNYCELSQFVDHYSQIVDKFMIELRSVYLALGLNLMYDDYDCYSENPTDYEDSNTQKSIFDEMTYPVNKNMFHNLSALIYKLNDANQMIGLSKTIYSLLDNWDDQVRLVFVTV